MKVTVGQAPHFTVRAERRPGEALDFSPKDVYALWKALNAQYMQLFDLATNFEECPECGGLHRKGTTPHEESEGEE